MTLPIFGGSWDVLAEAIAALVKWGLATFGTPTAEIRKKLVDNVTLPIPGEADAAKAIVDANLPEPK